MHSGASLLDRRLPLQALHAGACLAQKGEDVSLAVFKRPVEGSLHMEAPVLLVESPAKAKKLQQFLGDEYKVQ